MAAFIGASNPLAKATEGFPRLVKMLSLEAFHANPHQALIDAAAGDVGTMVYTVGRMPGDERLVRHVGVAVIVPVEEYRKLALKAIDASEPIAFDETKLHSVGNQ